MGRMFRIITEGGSEQRLHSPQQTVATNDRGNQTTMNALLNETIPFVEVGGPEGVVTSYSRTIHNLPPQTRVNGMPAPAPRVVNLPESASARVLNLPMPEQVRVVHAPVETIRVVHAPAYAEVREVAMPQQVQHDPRKLSVSLHKFAKPGLRILTTEIAPEVVTHHFPEHPVSAEYRLVRDEIRRTLDAGEHRVVSFTSVGHASGTTTVLLNVAVAMTQDRGTRVLVVDANLSRPSVAARLGAGDAPGVAEVIAQSVPLAWAVQTTSIAGLHVLAAGAATDQTLGLAVTELPRLIAQVKQWFDVVLVDAGLWDSLVGRNHNHVHAQHHSLATTSDSVYLVARQSDLERIEFQTLRSVVGTNLKGYITTRQ